MSRPTIFFSHSPIDKKPMGLLKSLFIDKTSGTIDVFLSSDGQSIPLGRNWVRRVEEALEECKLMFVFLTPASLQSKWIYFEAGYCHSKRIRVIPIGLLGVDLTRLPPPLSLLQGFNIISEDGLNNLIAEVNSEFEVRHKLCFSSMEYQQIECAGSNEERSDSTELDGVLESIELSVLDRRAQFVSGVKWNEITENIFKRRGIDTHRYAGYTRFLGGSVEVHVSPQETGINLRLDPLAIGHYSAFLSDIIAEAFSLGIDSVNINLVFEQNRHVITDHLQVGARLIGSESSQADGANFLFRGFLFSLHKLRRLERTALQITLVTADLNLANLSGLLELLISRAIK